MRNQNEYDPTEEYDEEYVSKILAVDKKITELTDAITNWDGKYIVDLKHAINQLDTYGLSIEYKETYGKHEHIFSYAGLKIEPIKIWGYDEHGNCLVGNKFPGEVRTPDEIIGSLVIHSRYTRK